MSEKKTDKKPVATRALTKLFGPRVALVPVNEKLDGRLILPETHDATHDLGRVLRVGTDIKDVKIPAIKVGDIVLFQTNALITQTNEFMVGGASTLVLHPWDLIAKLTAPVVKIENFVILGKWVLLKSEVSITLPDGTKSVIQVPEQADHPQSQWARYFVEQIGEQVDCCPGLALKQEVLINRARGANIIRFNDTVGDRYVYCPQNEIHGVVEEVTPEQITV